MSIDKMVMQHNRSRISAYNGDEYTALEIMSSLQNKTNEVIDTVNKVEDSNKKKLSVEEYKKDITEVRKISDNGDFTGSWFGIESPSFAEESQGSVIENNRVLCQKFKDTGFVSVVSYKTTSNTWSEAIQECINNADCDTILFPNGDYPVEKSIILRCNLKLVLEPNARIIRKHDTTMFLFGERESTFGCYNGVSNVVVTGGIIDMNGGIAYANGGVAFMLGHSKNVLFDNIKFRNGIIHSIEICSSKNVSVTNCIFYGSYSTAGQTSECIHLDIANCDNISMIGLGDNTPNTNIVVDNCQFLDEDSNFYNVAIGMHNFSEGVYNSNIRITNCYVKGSRSASITLSDVDNLYIDNIKLDNLGRKIIIKQNFEGISKNITLKNIFCNNTINTQSTFIQLEPFSNDGNGYFENLTIDNINCNIDGSTPTSGDFISCKKVRNGIIKNCRLTNLYNGIAINRSKNIVCMGNILYKNTGSGIRGFLSDKVTISNNLINDASRGIYLDQNMTNVIISDNNIENISSAPMIWVDNCQNIKICDNMCKKSSGSHGIRISGSLLYNVLVSNNMVNGVAKGYCSLYASNGDLIYFNGNIVKKLNESNFEDTTTSLKIDEAVTNFAIMSNLITYEGMTSIINSKNPVT